MKNEEQRHMLETAWIDFYERRDIRSGEADRNVRAPLRRMAALLAVIFMPLSGHSFNSQSNGSDGALDLSHLEPGTTFLFDPAAFDPPLDPDGDNVYHFTTIHIPAGVTVRMLAPQLNWAPVYWLASGEVRIDGTLNLRGQNAHPANPTPDQRRPSIPGPGGFPGGTGADNVIAATRGLGPGGGAPGSFQNGEHNYGNIYLLPLTGGSGGGGTTSIGGSGGGAGGGAIQIVSSEVIVLNGTITVRGGSDPSGKFGSGGSIRLIAPRLEGNGAVDARPGSGHLSAGHGRIRLEAREYLFTGSIEVNPARYRIVTLAPNTNLGLPTSRPPALRVVSIAGQPVAFTPSGSFELPDAVIDSADSVEVVIEASQIPLGTSPRLTFFNENRPNQTITSTPLEGTLESSSAIIAVEFPPGFSRGWVHATW
jgi:hypothetical protein